VLLQLCSAVAVYTVRRHGWQADAVLCFLTPDSCHLYTWSAADALLLVFM
jgi:hypothetical protein